jgi:nucleoside-diphosphate-sugar epimerase
LAGRTRITYTGSSWPGDAQRWEVSNDKIRSLGFTPDVLLTEGLSLTIQWFQQTLEPTGAISTIGAGISTPLAIQEAR